MNNMRNKILSLLVLLLTAATGARAQSNGTYSDLVEEIGSGGDKTLSHDYYKYEFGDPIEITVRGYELSIRKADAQSIEVEKIPKSK